jgi:hypothetical protein
LSQSSESSRAAKKGYLSQHPPLADLTRSFFASLCGCLIVAVKAGMNTRQTQHGQDTRLPVFFAALLLSLLCD